MLDLESFRAARARVASRITRTPLLRLAAGAIGDDAGVDARGVRSAPALGDRITADCWLKLECLQVTGSFKARGALNRVLSLPPETARRGIVTASGGNHGLAVAYAGRAVGAETTIYLPQRTSAEKAARIERWGARVVRAGDVWDDAHAAALAHAAEGGLTYVHPFADAPVIAGQGTIALEVFEDLPEVDAFVVAIGGGGLAAGLARAARLLRPGVRIIGVEPTGAPTLHDSLRAGRVVELGSITTAAGTLAPRRSAEVTFELVREHVDEIVLVTDDEMRDAARFLLDNAAVGVELSGAAAMAAVLAKKARLDGSARPCVLVCGAGSDALAPPPV